ncbi:DNA polymerase III polC-type [uncultured Clostridium sp.]|nr:DNA polymerase III polC-type [uncultured Clostridium sp.]
MTEQLPIFDLHTHSTASDGACTPGQVVQQAACQGVTTLALTDHDTVSGVAEAMSAGEKLGVRVIPGVELSVERAFTLHMLGYFVDTQKGPLVDLLGRMQALRLERTARMVEKLQKLGMDITYDEVRKFASGEVIARPHVARALMGKGYVDSVKEAFEKYIGLGGPAYVPKSSMDAREAIGVIRASGGAAVLAHPRLMHLPPDQIESLIREMAQAGMRGLECYYPKNPPEFTAWCVGLCEKYGLVATGGSDFHGENRPGQPVGTAQKGVRHPAGYPDCLLND